jgi:hypothetical protein
MGVQTRYNTHDREVITSVTCRVDQDHNLQLLREASVKDLAFADARELRALAKTSVDMYIVIYEYVAQLPPVSSH